MSALPTKKPMDYLRGFPWIAVMLRVMVITFFCDAFFHQLLHGFSVAHLGNLCMYLLFFYILIAKREKLMQSSVLRLMAAPALFLMLGLISALIAQVTPVLYLWSLRNQTRFFILFIVCYCLADAALFRFFLLMLDIAVAIHIPLTCFQFFVMGVRQDCLNGIFGTTIGNNGLNILLILYTCASLWRYHRKSNGAVPLILHILWMCVNAAMAELRIYPIELVILLIVYLCATRDFKRTLPLLPVILLILYGSAQLMYTLYPYTTGLFTILGLRKALRDSEHYDTGSDLGRTAVFKRMTPLMRDFASSNGHSGNLAIWLGIGPGNAEYANNQSFLNGPFYLQHVEKLQFHLFQSALLYVEGGILGLLAYASYYVVLFLTGLRGLMRGESKKRLWMILLAPMCLLLIFYCNSLRNNIGYLMILALAIPAAPGVLSADA